MRILNLEPKPFHRIQFLNAAKRGGVESQVLPITRGHIEALPKGLEAILVTGDLQGVVQVWQLGTTRLLGEELALEYMNLAEQGSVPQPERTGVILAGDFYAAPDGAKRGASGDVRSVWQAFADNFRWVTGVQGIHDRFGTEAERQELFNHSKVSLLDYESVVLDDLHIGGVSGIIGDSKKAGRREEREFLAALDLVLEREPNILVLHQGPNGDVTQRGSELVKQRIFKQPPSLTVCGHVHWNNALADINESAQVVNIDSRAIVLTS